MVIKWNNRDARVSSGFRHRTEGFKRGGAASEANYFSPGKEKVEGATILLPMAELEIGLSGMRRIAVIQLTEEF